MPFVCAGVLKAVLLVVAKIQVTTRHLQNLHFKRPHALRSVVVLSLMTNVQSLSRSLSLSQLNSLMSLRKHNMAISLLSSGIGRYYTFVSTI